MGMEKRGCLHSSDVRHWAVSVWGLWMDEPHTFPASWLLWEAPGMHVALCTVPHTEAGRPGHIPEDTAGCQDWLAPLTRWWHSQGTAPRDG